MDIFNVLTMIGGLALFLYGMHVMGDGLAKTSGGKLEVILEKFTSKTLFAVLLGAGVTAVIQSSSATTVMVVGFVNSGIMKLEQAVGIIMGANIGTTITSWILSLTGIQGDSLIINLLKPTSFSPVLAIIGVGMILFAKSNTKKDVGTILAGFAILMTGMSTMSDAVEPLTKMPAFTKIFLMFSDNPIIGVIVGTVLTAIIQSSSASVGILQAFCLTGTVSYASALPIIMGQNIGTCVTALLSAVGARKNAKRAAFVHFYFNLIGTVVFMIGINAFVHFNFLSHSASVAGIAVIHTAFNIIATVCLLPLKNFLVTLAKLTIKDNETDEHTVKSLLDERFLEKPAFAVNQAQKTAILMAKASEDALFKAIDLFHHYDKNIAEEVSNLEDMVDHYEDELGTYLMKLNNADLSDADSKIVSTILHCIGDFERISDHAVNLMNTANEVYRKDEHFSDKAKAELKIYEKAIRDIVSMTFDVFEKQDVAMAAKVEPLEEVIDTLNDEVKKKHVKRLRKGKCTIELGFVLSDITTNFERIADHCSNIGVCVTQVHEDLYDTHSHLDTVKNAPGEHFHHELEVARVNYMLP